MGPYHIRPGEIVHTIHHMRSQDRQILRPGATIPFAVRSEHLQLADLPIVDQLLPILLVRISAAMGNRDFDLVPLAGLQHRIGFG